MKILLSGFETFGHHSVNPTERLMRDVARNSDDFLTEPHQLRAHVLPVLFSDAWQSLEKEISVFKPDVVLAFGLAAGRSKAIEFERVAINCLDADIKDNAGVQPRNQKIIESGDVAFFSTLPIPSLIETLKNENILAIVSNTAGTYVCNYLFYRLMSALKDTGIRAGFIHVPLLPEQTVSKPELPSLAYAELRRALQLILEDVGRIG